MRLLAILGVAVVVLAAGFFFSQPPGCSITTDEFNRLTPGASYQQAVSIVGCEGDVLSSTALAGMSTVMYGWKGRGAANANAMFQNDALVSKAQFGLD